jgi:trehalose-phosphatase
MKAADIAHYWHEALRPGASLCLLSDLDGTLIPFASTPAEAVPTPEVIALVARLAASPDTWVALVSGRPRDFLDAHFGDIPGVHLVAEHGVWHRHRGHWQTPVGLKPAVSDDLAKLLEVLASRYAGALVERKTWSVGLHYRRVKASERAALMEEAAALVGPWLAAHDEYEHLAGEQVMEFRPRSARKSAAVDWIKNELGFAGRCIAVGDDVTDEDLFTALGDGDDGILVSERCTRPTAARWLLPSIEGVVGFYGQMVALRGGDQSGASKGAPWPQPLKADPGRPAQGSEPHLKVQSTTRL